VSHPVRACKPTRAFIMSIPIAETNLQISIILDLVLFKNIYEETF